MTINPLHLLVPLPDSQIGLEHRVAGVHAMTFEPGEILCAYQSDDLARKMKRKYAEQARTLVAQGVDVLVPGGGIPMLLFSRIRGHAVDGAPVINGISTVVKAAETAVKLRRLIGLGVSRTADHAKAPLRVIEEFLTNPKGL